MSALDYIKIRGLDGELGHETTEYFEIFQGAGGSSGLLGGEQSNSVAVSDGGSLMVQIDNNAPISEDAEIAEALWEAQNALIEEESAYLHELNEIFKGKQTAIPNKQNAAFDFIAEVAEWGVGKLAYLVALSKSGGNVLIAEAASFLLEIGTGMAIDALRMFLAKGQELCTAIDTENTAMLALESSLRNYDLRRENLKLHTEQIENILHHISLLETQLSDTLSGEEKGEGDDWAEWITSMDESTGEISKWLEDAFAAADVNYDTDAETTNLPVPVVPNLPTLPPSNDPKVIAFWFLLKFGTKVLVELLKNWIEKGHGKNHEEFLLALKDLKYNDEMLDLGGVRVWLKNKVIEYG